MTAEEKALIRRKLHECLDLLSDPGIGQHPGRPAGMTYHGIYGRLCLYCHRPLSEAEHPTRLYCGAECEAKAHNPPVVNCPECGEPYAKITADWHHCPVSKTMTTEGGRR